MPDPVTLIGINYAPEPTGIAPYTQGAAAGLESAGRHVQVITGFPHYPQWQISPDYRGLTMRERIDGVEVLRLRHPVPRNGSQLQRAAMEIVFGVRACLARWGRHGGVVVTVSPPLISCALVVTRARLRHRPVIVWVQDIYTLGAAQTGSSDVATRVLRAIERWTLSKATRVIAIHERFKTYLSTDLGIPSERIDVVRNWTHLSTRADRSQEFRHRHGWGDKETVVLHAGNMGAKQNLENVVRASQLAEERHDPVRFVLLGDGNRREALEAMGPNNNLQYIDPLDDDDFASALASADVLLVNELPGMTEMSVPSKLTSYFSTGLPVLAAVDQDSVTAEEVALSGGGVQVDADDPRALLEGVLRLRNDPALAERLGAAGLRHCAETLSAETATQGLAASIDRAAQGSTAGPAH